MKVIGLTGSIGSGKSTVSNYLIRKGFIVIDSDAISHAVVRKGKPALKEIADAFGKKVIGSDGELDRKKLADIVFKNKNKKAILERIVTARVIKEIKKELGALKKGGFDGTVFVDAPILFESNASIPMNQTWVVVANDGIRARRVMERDGCTFEEFERRSSSQLSQEEKIKRADRVIDNSGTPRQLYSKVRKLINEIDADLQ